jgi:hypothetical protein
VNFGFNAWIASPFTTDSQTWTVTSATVLLEIGAINSSAAGVRLLSNSAGRPGTVVADFGNRVVTNRAEQVTFTAAGGVTLQPSTTYWLAVGNVGTNGGLNVGVLQQGAPLTNSGAAGTSMPLSTSSGPGSGGNSPTNWSIAAPGFAILFGVEGTRSSGPGDGPTLSITSTNQQRVILSWPATFTGYLLEAKPTLVSTNWTAITNPPPVVVNGQWTVTLNSTNASRYFRLQKP